MQTALYFTSKSAKRSFVRQNAISSNEIAEQTPTMIVLIESDTKQPVNWGANPNVFLAVNCEMREGLAA